MADNTNKKKNFFGRALDYLVNSYQSQVAAQNQANQMLADNFDNNPKVAKPLMEHLRRSFNYTLKNLGPHKLPLIGRADWNDCLNLNCFSWDPNESFQTTENKTEGTKAESLMIAGLL